MALHWYRLSSDQGNGFAQNDLGAMYQHGDGVLQDYEEAARLYRLGAEKGYMVAQSNLAAMYYKDRGVRQDVREAFRLETLAAEQNFGLAQRMLGIMYMDGTGIPQDYVQAHKWLNLSNAQGDKEAGVLRDELAKRMTLDQIAEAQKLAREWTPNNK
jgi:TPR repeat protein